MSDQNKVIVNYSKNLTVDNNTIANTSTIQNNIIIDGPYIRTLQPYNINNNISNIGAIVTVSSNTSSNVTNLSPQDLLGPFYRGQDTTIVNQVQQTLNGLTMPELFNTLNRYGININDWKNANIRVDGNRIILNYTYSSPLTSVFNDQVVGQINKEYTMEIENINGWVVVKYVKRESGTYMGNPITPTIQTAYYVINPITKEIIETRSTEPIPTIVSGYITPPSNVINEYLRSYGYRIPDEFISQINNLQPGQSITIYARAYNYDKNEWGSIGASFKITNLGDGQYRIESTDKFYNIYNFYQPWTSLDITVTLPRYTYNIETNTLTTTDLKILGNVTTAGTTSIERPYLEATYNINQTIPIISKIQNDRFIFQTGTPQTSVTLQNINLPTITSEQLQALQSGQNISIKPGWYYNPDTRQIVQIVQQTNNTSSSFIPSQASNYNLSSSPQTIKDLPKGTHLFLNPVGYSSLNPNNVSYIGVNFDTNTVYLINAYGQVIKAQSFKDTQSMFNYLENKWNIDLTPKPVPGQAVLTASVKPDINSRIESIILHNDELVRQSIKRLFEKPETFLQDISTIVTAGASTALAEIKLIGPAETLQNIAEIFYYDPVLGNIAGSAILAGSALMVRTAPRIALHAGLGAITGWGLGELFSGGTLSPSEKIAHAEIGAVTTAAGSIISPLLSTAFAKGAGKLTTAITKSEEMGSKIAGLKPLWEFTGEFTTNLAIGYPFFRDNPQELLLWSTGLATVGTLGPRAIGATLSRLDVKRGKALMAKETEIKTELAKEPVKGFEVEFPNNDVLLIVPRPTYGEGRNVWEFANVYVKQKGENNLIAHVTPDMGFVNKLSKGEEVVIKPSGEGKAEKWRTLGKFTGMYFSPGENQNTAVALGFYGGITDTSPTLGYSNLRGTSLREEIYRLLHPFDRAGIILARSNIEMGPLPPKELIDYTKYLMSKYKGDREKVMQELLNHPEYGKMFMEWRNTVREYSATKGVPVLGSEDILGLTHERQVIVEPGAKLKGTGVTYNVWIRQTPELLKNLPGPIRDILSDWSKIKVTYTEIKPGKPLDLFNIENANNQRKTTITQNSESITKPSRISYSEASEAVSNILNREPYRRINPYKSDYINYVREPIYYNYRETRPIERIENIRYPNYNIERHDIYDNRYITRGYNIYTDRYLTRDYDVYSTRYITEDYSYYNPPRYPYSRPEPYEDIPERPPKKIPPTNIPSFGLPMLSIRGAPSTAVQAILGKAESKMSDVAYAFYQLWR